MVWKMDGNSGGILGNFIPHAQLATELGISLKTLENMNRAGKAPPRVKLGRFTYYREEGVREWSRTKELGQSD